MGKAKNWTQEEIDYLSENWGQLSVPYMTTRLSRSNGAIKQKASKLGLGRYFDRGEYVTLHQLMIAITGSGSNSSYAVKSWGKNRGLPIHNKRLDRKVVRVVYLDEFWRWAEENKTFIDFSKMEPLILGKEPKWVAEQRKKDIESYALQRKDAWTPFEDEKLIYYLNQYKYTYVELSKMLKRSCGAIQRRCTDLGIKARPVKADNHGPASVWTTEMYEILAEGIRNGSSYVAIGEAIGKSEKAIRGKVYYMYFTEDADKVRAMLQDGEWGSGRPEIKVKQAIHHSEYRTEAKELLSEVIGLLVLKINQMQSDGEVEKYVQYWQRFMCMKWSDICGCKAKCEGCDECTELERIPPQYCARCGCTFFERVKNRFCSSCRIARKKKAQKHWVMSKKG